MNVWLVTESDWEYHAVLAVWSTKAAAEADATLRAIRYREENPGFIPESFGYEVEGPFEVHA